MDIGRMKYLNQIGHIPLQVSSNWGSARGKFLIAHYASRTLADIIPAAQLIDLYRPGEQRKWHCQVI